MRAILLPALALLAVFLGVTYMYGNWRIYWLGVSFGMRGYVDLPCVFVFGFAAVTIWLALRIGRQRAGSIARLLTMLFALVNLHLMVAFQSGAVWVDGATEKAA